MKEMNKTAKAQALAITIVVACLTLIIGTFLIEFIF